MIRFARLAGIVLATVALPTTAAAAGTPQPRIFNGTQVSISQAPWQVLVYSDDGYGITTCGGSIISSTEVLTAAHCVSDVQNSGAIGLDPAGDGGLGIIAGVSNYRSSAQLSYFFTSAPPLPAGDAEQHATVVSARVHPNWVLDESGQDQLPSGDVAVITLDHELDLSGPDVRPVALPPSVAPVDGEPIPVNASVRTVGFGMQRYNSDGSQANPDGKLYQESLSIVDPDACGSFVDAAVNLCGQTAYGTTCHGDSGSGLVTTDVPPVLVGLVSSGPDPCQSGQPTYFSSLVAPENRVFLTGSNAPPRAPRQHSPVGVGFPTTLRVGDQISCSGGSFTDATQIKWKVTNDQGTLLGQGNGPSFPYVLGTADIGHRVTCRAFASSPGGVAVSPSASTASVVGGASSAGPVVTATPTPAPVLVPVSRAIEAVTAPNRVRRGKVLTIQVSVTAIPAGASSVIVSAPRIGVAARSRVDQYSITKSPAADATSLAFTLRLRAPRHARPGVRKIPVKVFVYLRGLLQSDLTQTVAVRITR